MSRYTLSLALEGHIDGLQNREMEYTFYAKLKDFADLESATRREQHEQWVLPLKTEQPVKTRLRLTDDTLYELTAKTRRPGVVGVMETNKDIGRDLWLQLRAAATEGYRKTRYVWAIGDSDYCWEIDVFMGQDGKPHAWVKIDYEIKDVNDKLPPFPIPLEDIILAMGPKYDESQRAWVDKLWQNEWCRIDDVKVIPT